jgi:hypothetical protein
MRKGCPAIAFVVIPMISIDRLLVSPINDQFGRSLIRGKRYNIISYVSKKHDRILLLYILFCIVPTRQAFLFVKPNVSTHPSFVSKRLRTLNRVWPYMRCNIIVTVNRLNKRYCYILAQKQSVYNINFTVSSFRKKECSQKQRFFLSYNVV